MEASCGQERARDNFIYRYMSKAFDSLCPALTIKKLEAYGFGNRSLDLMQSFFHRRLSRVKINGHTSEWKTMIRDYPQGTAFGPLLWNTVKFRK